MAHGREKIGLGPAGLLGNFLRGQKFARARRNVLLQLIALARQPRIAFSDLADHGVEALGEIADLVIGLCCDIGFVIVTEPDSGHRTREIQERSGDVALHLDGDRQPDRGGKCRCGDGDEQHILHPFGKVAGIADQGQASNCLAAIVDRDRRAHAAAADQRRRVDPFSGADHDVAVVTEQDRGAEFGQEPALGIMDDGIIHLGNAADGTDHREDLSAIACFYRLGGSCGENMCRGGELFMLLLAVALHLAPQIDRRSTDQRDAHGDEHEAPQLEIDRLILLHA